MFCFETARCAFCEKKSLTSFLSFIKVLSFVLSYVFLEQIFWENGSVGVILQKLKLHTIGKTESYQVSNFFITG